MSRYLARSREGGVQTYVCPAKVAYIRATRHMGIKVKAVRLLTLAHVSAQCLESTIGLLELKNGCPLDSNHNHIRLNFS